MKKLIMVLMLSIGFTTAVNAGGYTPTEIQEDRPAWNYLTNQWEKLDCDTDTDCEQKYGEEPVHQLDDETYPPAQLYPLIYKGINDENKIERRIT